MSAFDVFLCYGNSSFQPLQLGQKKKELCLSFLKVKTLSAMRFFFFFFFFLVKKGYADAEIPPIFFLLHFSATIFFRGRSAAVF